MNILQVESVLTRFILLWLGVIDPHISALLWMGVLASLVIVLIMPQPLGIRALVIVTILRLIFSVGLEPTLFLLGAFNVSLRMKTFFFLYKL